MRFYSIALTDPSTKKSQVYWTSYVNGQNDPGALNIELDVFDGPGAGTVGDISSYCRIWGIPLQALGGAANINGFGIEIRAGMQKGLPLANPTQIGPIASGVIRAAFGNWVGTDMTLDLLLQPLQGSASPVGTSTTDPLNIVLAWPANTPLADWVALALQIAYPDASILVSISDKLVRPNYEHQAVSSFSQFCTYIKQMTRNLIGGKYAGVDIVQFGNLIRVFDGTVTGPAQMTSPLKPKQINFADLIGQPTWYGVDQINLNCVMRGDLQVGDFIQMPRTPVITGPQSQSQSRQASIFQSIYAISQIHHVGNFRQPDAASWITTVFANTTVSGQPA